MEIKHKYLYKKMFVMHETENIKEVTGMDYKIILNVEEFTKVKRELENLKNLREDYVELLTKSKELDAENKEENQRKEEIIISLEDNIKELKNDDIEVFKEKIKFIEIELTSALNQNSKLAKVEKSINSLIVGLVNFKTRDPNNIFNIDEIIAVLKEFDLENGVDKLLVFINSLRNYIGKFFNEKNEFRKQNIKLMEELKLLRDDKTDIVAGKRQVENFKDVVERKQRNIKKLKLEIELLRNKKNKTSFKDISLDYEGDSTYRAYKTYDLAKINRKNYMGEEVVVLPFSMEKSKEEVIEYIKNSHINNPMLDKLKNEKDTKVWKIQTSKGYWQVILVQK